MLRISKLTDYATLIMSHLAADPERLESAAVIADALHLGLPTVSKLLKLLADAGLVTSARGSDGGYRLARSPAQITLSDVIAAIDGDLALTICCEGDKLCSLNMTCTIQDNWKVINHMVQDLLAQFTVKDMTSPLRSKSWLYGK
ncbi:MAG: SUF system Fe-S cluster assembly regulator [Gammaproteobacteria bacterium RIFCSPHIGHO2_12_FULL_37_14]|nr:MAG: SUF system Fe-S cluster assembly regulator [Gammaproteobacteria bacterium RIFCSPHIGHO2_12_FULL_37_14]